MSDSWDEAVSFVLKTLGVLFIVFVAIGSCANNAPVDDCDSPIGRCGMKPMTDHRTGCQYLATSSGGLTPRLDADGRQICRKEPRPNG